MRKEILFALITGIAFGLVIAFGIWRANYKRETQVQLETKIEEKKPETKERSPQNGLTILKPEENEISTQDTIRIEGITEPETEIIISSEDGDYLTKSNKDGGFAQEIKLVGGFNEIVITAFTKKEEITTKLPLFYSSEF